MGSVEIIAGIGVLLFIVAYVMFQVNRRDDPQQGKHFLLQLFLFFMLFSLIALLGATVYNEKDYCEWLPSNSTSLNDTVTYEHSYVCSVNGSVVPETFYNVTTWIFRIGILYIFLYFVYEALNFLGVQIPFVQRVVDNMNSKRKNDKGFGRDGDDD